MDLAGSQYGEENGYQSNLPNNYPKSDKDLGKTLPSESEHLNWPVNDSLEAFSHDGRDDSTGMEADETLNELRELQKDSACQSNRSYQPKRLLHITHDGKFTLEEFDTRRDKIPPYAVLSCAPDDGDMIYRDLKSFGHQQSIHTIEDTGWEKIRFCAKQTKYGGPNYFWIETCCVNLASSSEVKECIDSTLRRLKNAQTCYVLLQDVPNRSLEGDGESVFKKSVWFTQCWTLLDLVVPPSVEFFSRDGTRLGNRASLLNVIQDAIGLPSQTSSVTDLSLFNDLSYSDLKVLTLSSHRKTICEGNSVYCLFGKFGCSKVTLFDEDKDPAWLQLQNVMQDEKRREKIYRWLSAPDPWTNYRKARKQREPGTGLWFLNSAEYKGWRDRIGSSRLWIRGTAGSGKTILSSTVIENLQQHCSNNASMATAYFYFDIHDNQKRDARPMLRALLHQLLGNLTSIPDDIAAFCTAHQAELKDPQRSIDMLLGLLKHLMLYFTKIYVVLDALDECPKRREALLTVLQQMMDWRSDNLHILVTSRGYSELSESLGCYFDTREVVSIGDKKLDIQRLCHDERWAKWKGDIDLMQEMQTSLAYVTDGRVYEAESQLTMLSMCLTQVQLRESLATLVQKTDDQYNALLCSAGQEISHCFRRILKWLACSKRPLGPIVVREIIALDSAEYPNFDSTAFENAPVLQYLRRLGIWGSEQQYTMVDRERPSSFLEDCSILRYLFSDRIKQGPAYQYSLKEEDCHKTIARDCLKYLLHREQRFADDVLKLSSPVIYAADHWTWHFEMAGNDKEDLIPLAMRIFSGESSIFPDWIRLYNDRAHFAEQESERSLEGVATPLYYASQLGLVSIATLLLQKGADVNSQGGRYGSALQAAASKGHLQVVKILLNNGADISARGGHFGSAIHAARVCGHIPVVDLILEFSESTAGSNIPPSDSGYASQMQADSLVSPSILCPQIQHDPLAEHQSTNEAPEYCGEETNLDDIRSIQSDSESIGSKISTTRSRAELFAVKHLVTFFAQLEDLRSLHEMALQKIERRRFISNYRRILKSYYKRLLTEAVSEIEKAVTRVLRSRRNRESIAEGIADQLELDEENEQPSLETVRAQPVEKQYLEDWLRRMQGTDDYERSAVVNQQLLLSDFRLEDSGSDRGLDTGSEADAEDAFMNIDGAERFLQQGVAFHNLVLDIRLLMLPHHLRQIVETTPKSSLQLIVHSDMSWVNDAKAFLETYTGYRWDWWPFTPRIPVLGAGEQHLKWKLSRRVLYTKMTQEQAENMRGILDLAVEPCLQSDWHRSAMSGSISSKAAMAYTPTPNNTSASAPTPHVSGSNASGVTLNNNSNNGPGSNLQTQRRTATDSALNVPKTPTRVIFGVQGMRRSLEIEQIEICNQMNDQRFFRELNRRYKKHRWSLQRLLSPFRFQYCNFVKFEKLNVNRIFSSGEGLPDPNGFADDYDYNPKPPQGKIPLIEPDLFAVCLQSCEDNCKWSLLGPWLHDCFQLPPLCDKIICIPKKKSEFPVQCKQVLRDTAWGIEAEYTLSFWMLCMYHLIPLLSSFSFWVYWLIRSPGDWQNASVPTITTIALFTFVWVPFGFVFNSHRPVRYR